MLLRFDAHELHHNANPIAGAEDRALQHRVDAEKVRNVTEWPIRSLEGANRLPGHDA
jgi:hypothetical protein